MASRDHHAGHGAQGGDHSPVTDQLSPNEHRQHAEPDEHTGHTQRDEHAGHGGHGDHAAQFRDRFWWSLALTIPVIAYSEMVQEWLRFTPPQFPGSQWVAPVLGTIVFLYGGRPFLQGGLAEARSRQPGMMLLISLAILVAFGASLTTALGLLNLEFWWELSLLIVIMLLGHWLEMRALGQASGALDALAALLPDQAERVVADGRVEPVPVSELAVGDVVLVRSGGRVPADGMIVEGSAELDESMITGESRPVAKEAGDRVVAGTVATDSTIRVRVTAVGEQTALAGIRRLVARAQASGSRAQALADRAAGLLFYFAVGAGLITMLVWLTLGEPDQAIERTVTVLVIACPHALGLAIPLVIVISTALAARNGILVKDRLALERMRTVDAVLFDKTGTLTKGEPQVSGVAAVDGDTDGLLRLAGAVETDSEHPLARAIVTAARERGELPRASSFRSMTGRGVQARVDGATIAVGGPALLGELDVPKPEALAEQIAQWKQRGAAVLYVVTGDKVLGALALEDAVRPESRQAVDELHRLGRRAVMLTGDARQVAEAVATELGVDEVFAEILPEDKDQAVADLQARGLKVAMVGDGVNDAPALARAEVGIAIGAGTDVAIESAGIVLAANDPRGVLAVLRLSQAGYRKMLQNLGWATGYNLLAVPVAAGVLAWAGVTLAPALGAILMSASTIVVALNAQLLRRLDLRPASGRGRRRPQRLGWRSVAFSDDVEGGRAPSGSWVTSWRLPSGARLDPYPTSGSSSAAQASHRGHRPQVRSGQATIVVSWLASEHGLWWVMAQQSEPAVQTFLFADLSGFTALTEAHGDEQAADLVGGFCVAVRQLLAAHQAQEVKTIGDALMLRTADAAAAIQLGLCIVHDVGAQHGFPLVRVGMHTGPAVERDGDWFGTTGNLAARVSAAAAGGEALLTAATRAAAGGVEGVELREHGRRAFRNVGEPVQVYAAVRQGAHSSSGLPIDPVCRMAVDPGHGAGRLTHEGVEYRFCSLGCAGAFAQHPSRYTAPEQSFEKGP